MKKLSILLLFCIGLVSCSGNDDENNNDSRIVKATIQDAEYIYQNLAQGNLKSTSSNPQTFWTTDKYGKAAPIQFITEKGDTINLQISNVFDINDQYLMLKGSFDLNNGQSSHYFNYILADKETEAIYGLPIFNISIYSPSDFYSYTDKNSSIYIKSHYGSGSISNMIYKIDLSEPTNLYIEEYIPKNQNIGSFLVNKNGVCCLNSDNRGLDCKFKTPGGSIYLLKQLINDSEIFASDIFIGFDGSFYVATNQGGLTIYKITENSNKILVAENVYESAEYYYHAGSFLPDYKNKVHIMSDNSKTLIFNEQTKEIKELNSKLPFTSNNLDGFRDSYYATSDALYIKENSEQGIIHTFTKLNLNDYSLERLNFMENGYEAYAISASIKTPELSFSGLRFSDSKNVIGSIDATGKFSAFENIHLASKATTLIRLN